LGLNFTSFTQLHCPWFSISYVLYLNVPGSTLKCNYNLMSIVLESKGVRHKNDFHLGGGTLALRTTLFKLTKVAYPCMVYAKN